MADSLVSVQREDNIVVLNLDDKKVNVFSAAMAEELQQCFDEIDPEVGAVIVKGRPGIFSAGFDLKILNGDNPEAIVEMVSKTVILTTNIMCFPRPVVGVVTGHSIGIGTMLLMAMDYRIGVRGDFRIGLNEIMNGLEMPNFAFELPRFRLPVTNLMAATLHTSLCTPDEAVHAGYLEEAVKPIEVMETAMVQACDLARLPNPAYQVSKLNLLSPIRDRILSALEKDLENLRGDGLTTI